MNLQEQQEIELQRRYYAETADEYNQVHVSSKDEHFLALGFMVAALDYLEIQSILDVGSGTGRALSYIKNKRPNIQIIGIEPVKELREIGYSNGLSDDELTSGDATQIEFDDGQFDLVCEFGVLHHIRRSETAVSEMLRVAKKAIFISDSNNFGQGSPSSRLIKQLINAFGLWGFADFIKTKGKGYTILEGDGLTYSYSVFNHYKQIKRCCKSVHLLNTSNGGINPYRTAGHVALLGVK
ncbi:class I SAM-dependent methyltransferase [Nostoc sp. CENA67]|uniref:Class I SAM-dependent methyltransferase n=1 Tax=Amazonocrinis nigriterrae CENA67 TaxID=2794033 RepID=A0A8J7L7H7_9NOST|nr:class I SAM-dependent methyltransferase [Amazonocrinis nigriterrae]MBH8561031.1 class I SAM-dependent methyltransferase [Amazonocrinis nigriterrae CENA67]